MFLSEVAKRMKCMKSSSNADTLLYLADISEFVSLLCALANLNTWSCYSNDMAL